VSLPESGTVPMAAPNDVFDPLVRRRKPLHFWDLGSPNLDRSVLREAGHFALRQAGYATIRNLHLQAVALLQGQDINVLYVSFGVLRWSPDPDGRDGVPLPAAPRAGALEPHESGCGLRHELHGGAGRGEPGPAPAPGAARHRRHAPARPGRAVSGAVRLPFGRDRQRLRRTRGVEVEDSCLLGSFPLLKLRLYEDFVAQEAKALGHPLIAAIAGEEGALQNGLPAVEVPTLAQIEVSHAGEGGHLLLDADPAQERAILAAARGQSFVLQGPPGHGQDANHHQHHHRMHRGGQERPPLLRAHGLPRRRPPAAHREEHRRPLPGRP
jgi:hypothetical protein